MNQKDKLILKNMAYSIFYIIIILAGINIYVGKKNYIKVNNNKFFAKLKEINYFKTSNDPYINATKLEIHPTNYFSIPINSKHQNSIENNAFSLNLYNHRKNPYNNFNEGGKNCIFFTGSSAAFGIGVSDDKQTIPAHLHKLLGDKYLIYNLAIPSWNSRQELISLINSFIYKDFDNCSNFKTISFSGTADINGIKFSKRSDLFNNNLGKALLLNAPEQYSVLEDRLNNLKKIESNIKYNLRITINQIYRNLFGNLDNLIRANLKNREIKNSSIEYKKIKKVKDKYTYMKARNFINNQKLINNFMQDLGGQHFVFIQPNLKNYKTIESSWHNINKIFSEEITKNNCLNIIDLRKFLISEQKQYNLDGELIPLSLKESIKKNFFKKSDLDNHYYYDNSHMTNIGSEIIAKNIYINLTKEKTKNEKCSLIQKNIVNSQNK